MAELKKATVAANAAKIDEVSAKVDERAAAVDKALEEKVAKIDAIAAELERLKAENAKLQAIADKIASGAVVPAADDEGAEVIIEIVSVPPEGVIPPDVLTYKGKKYKGTKVSGFMHYKVPRSFAEVLLTDRSTGVTHYLTGTAEPLQVKRKAGSRAKDVTVTPRMLDKTSNGTPFWKEVILEESV